MPRLVRGLAACLAVLLGSASLALSASPSSATAAEAPDQVLFPAPTILLAGEAEAPVHIPPPEVRTTPGQASLVAHSTFNVTYTGFTPQAQAAFQYAVDLLASVVYSPVPIVVDAHFMSLAGQQLGSAGPAALRSGGPFGLPANRFYPTALLNAITGTDVCPAPATPSCGTAVDINAQFSNSSNFYLGTDGNTPLGQFDLVSVVLHELVHGLGFLASTLTIGAATATRDLSNPVIFEDRVETGAGTALGSIASGTAALRSAAISDDLFFDGPKTIVANHGVRPKVYAPTTYAPGGSIAHLDEGTYPATNPNTLMTPIINDGQSIHDPGPIGRAVLGDLGYNVAPYPPTHRTVSDFDGDGATDVAVFRPSTGQWFRAGGPSVAFGANGDVPVAADYDGDGDADVAVFRPSSGQWFVAGLPSSSFGTSGDVPVAADYDGDGDADVAVFRPSSGQWFVAGLPSSSFGTSGDVPVPADYDGDGDADVAVFRPSSGQWFVAGLPSSSFGTSGDVPVPADYDGDGDADVAVFRPSSGQWFVAGLPSSSFGTSGDVPSPGDYDGDGSTDIAVFRPSSGQWFVRGRSPLQYGTAGDIPTPKRASLSGGG